jgi:hypothetical protein
MRTSRRPACSSRVSVLTRSRRNARSSRSMTRLRGRLVKHADGDRQFVDILPATGYVAGEERDWAVAAGGRLEPWARHYSPMIEISTNLVVLPTRSLLPQRSELVPLAPQTALRLMP